MYLPYLVLAATYKTLNCEELLCCYNGPTGKFIWKPAETLLGMFLLEKVYCLPSLDCPLDLMVASISVPGGYLVSVIVMNAVL